MDIHSVSIRYGRRWNLSDFESIDVEAFYSAKIDPNENPLDAAETLTALAKEAVKGAVKPVLEANEHQRNKAKITRRYMGQPVEEDELEV